MPDRVDSKSLLIGAATAGAAAGAAALASGERKSKLVEKKPLERQRRRLERRRLERRAQRAKEAEIKKHPQRRWAEKARNENPKAFRRAVKQGRLARRAAKASGRMGALGMAVNIPGALREAQKIDKEGGRWIDRFGKFVEVMTSMPPGSSGRGMTDAERKAASST